MSTVKKVRYILALVAAVSAVGLMVDGQILTGIFCLVTAVLLLPILYERLLITSNEVQFVSPMVFLALAVFSTLMFHAVPMPYEAALKNVYEPSPTAVTQTTTSLLPTTTVTKASAATTTVTKAITTTTVRTLPATTTIVTEAPTTVVTTTVTYVVTTSVKMTEPVHTTTDAPVVTTTRETAPPVASVGNMVYRTPSGKRYHLDPNCGGKNSYAVSYEQAVGAGLTPCKKCAGG